MSGQVTVVPNAAVCVAEKPKSPPSLKLSCGGSELCYILQNRMLTLETSSLMLNKCVTENLATSTIVFHLFCL